MSQHPRLGPHQQPALPLIQMRKDRLELGREHLPGLFHDAHTTPTSRIPEGYGLFFCAPLAAGTCSSTPTWRASTPSTRSTPTPRAGTSSSPYWRTSPSPPPP